MIRARVAAALAFTATTLAAATLLAMWSVAAPSVQSLNATAAVVGIVATAGALAGPTLARRQTAVGALAAGAAVSACLVLGLVVIGVVSVAVLVARGKVGMFSMGLGSTTLDPGGNPMVSLAITVSLVATVFASPFGMVAGWLGWRWSRRTP